MPANYLSLLFGPRRFLLEYGITDRILKSLPQITSVISPGTIPSVLYSYNKSIERLCRSFLQIKRRQTERGGVSLLAQILSRFLSEYGNPDRIFKEFPPKIKALKISASVRSAYNQIQCTQSR